MSVYDPGELYLQRFHDLEASDYGQPFPGCSLDLDQLRSVCAEDTGN